MLTVGPNRTAAQSREIQIEAEIIERAEALLGQREARIFPPDRVVPEWQIFVRHSTITTDTHATFADAARGLIGRLEAERGVD